MFRSECTSSQCWSIRTWFRVDAYTADTVLYLRAIQDHSGGKHINPTLQDNVMSPFDFAEHIYRVGSHDTHSITQSGLISAGNDVKKGRHALFFTAMNPMFIDIIERGITTWRSPGLQCTNTIGKDTKTQCIGAIWGSLKENGCSSTKRDQTRSSHTTLYLRCASRRWWSGSQNCTVKCFCLLSYRKELCWSRTCIMNGRTLQALTRERPSTILARQRGLRRWNVQRTLLRWDSIQDARIAPFGCPRVRSHPQASSPKLAHQFETHANKEALQADLKQNRAFICGEQSKEMIHSMGNEEHFEICEITPKIECPNCVTNWTKGIVNVLRNMLMTFRQSSKTKQRPLRCCVDSQLRHQERSIPWSTPRENREAKNLPCRPSLF